MVVKNISENLLKYKTITPPDDHLRAYISEFLKNAYKIPVSKKDVKINKKIAYVKVASVVKSEIFLKKHLLIDAIKDVFGKKLISDIK